ncbi:hypothetical protein M404DRAFT_202756 [Pisolithus tinctorius Marx 270]|uniref:Uncharacterized protein n=1 Tax=Pisolithus tinctorius Marx 270 TaxID=870435 RepID=A0A0C3PZ78_PISTI|nr:hypothetical protein M404DRAFT_202756 [Pisolithus tinctorius Marx 270]
MGTIWIGIEPENSLTETCRQQQGKVQHRKIGELSTYPNQERRVRWRRAQGYQECLFPYLHSHVHRPNFQRRRGSAPSTPNCMGPPTCPCLHCLMCLSRVPCLHYQ